MKSKLLLTFFVVVSASVVQSQNTFQKAYGGDYHDFPWDAKQTFDGGYLVTGLTTSYGPSAGAYIIKTNLVGDVIWSTAITPDCGNCTAESSANATIQLQDSSLATVGNRLVSSSGYYANLIKLKSNGDTSWVRTYAYSSGLYGNALKQTTDGGYILGCISWDEVSENANDFALIKTDSVGAIQWSKTYTEAQSQYLYDVITTTDGGFLLAGDRLDPDGVSGVDSYLIKTNSNGDTLWTNVYSGNGQSSQRTHSVIQTTDGGFLLSGFSAISGDSINGSDIFIIKTDSNGELNWSKTYGTPYSDEARMAVELNDGSFLIVGRSDASSCLMKINSSGDFQWVTRFDNDRFNSVRKTSDGGAILCGYTSETDGICCSDIYLVKTNGQFTTGCSEQSSSMFEQDVTSTTEIHSSNPQVLSNGATVISSASTVATGAGQTDICYTGVNDNPFENPSVVVSPNPSNGYFTISATNPFYIIEVYDVLGKVVFSKRVESKRQAVNLISYPKGIYFVRLKSDLRTFYSDRIVITN